MKKTWILIGLLLLLLPVSSAMAACSCADYEYLRSRVTYAQRDSEYHWQKTYFTFRCSTCGDTYETPWNEDYFLHQFSGNKCTLCGYTRSSSATPTPRPTTPATCSHTNHRSVPYGNPEYIDINDPSEHRIVRHFELICNFCGKVIEPDYAGRTTGPHDINSAGKCIKCGYTEAWARATATPRPAQTYSVSTTNSSLETGSVVTFGHYEQDGSTVNGTEPIRWVILNKQDGYALLYAVNILDVQPYNRYGDCDSWLDSSIRSWLNANFRNSAFTASEQKSLLPGKPFNKTEFSENDQIFLPSYDERVTPLLNGLGLGALFIQSNYRGSIYENTSVTAFEYAPPTVYALNKNADACKYYWDMRGSAKAHMEDCCFYTVNHKALYGVRPACWVKENALMPAN